MHDLFFGMGTGHSIMLLGIVIAAGLFLGKFKFKGISLGATWILFVGIALSHFGFRAQPELLHFLKEFGLILFVFSIGLQVGPGFFHSFKKGGLLMNMLALSIIFLGVITTYVISLVTGEDLPTMVGVMSGAVTNTPGLGAAQQTYFDIATSTGLDAAAASASSASLASGYAVAYPLGVIGVILVVILLKGIFKVDPKKEEALLDGDSKTDGARRMHCMVENPAVFGKSIKDVTGGSDKFIISRMMRGETISIPGPDTVLEKDDKLLIVTSQANVDSVRIIFGEEIPMHVQDWEMIDTQMHTKKMIMTNASLTGAKVSDLQIRSKYGVTLTRVIRAGVELVARPNLLLQFGDGLKFVGTEEGLKAVEGLVGNKTSNLNHPYLIPIFLGIAIGVIFGSIPFAFPGIPQPIKLGLAGGPLIIAILIGYFGPKFHVTTYTTASANMMIREIGISIFLAAVGLGAGENFVSSITNGGYWWILYGFLITLIPVTIVGLVSRLVFKLNFLSICGLIAGSTTNPPVLAFSQQAYGSDYTSVAYATVYPLSMFFRVLMAQMLIIIALS